MNKTTIIIVLIVIPFFFFMSCDQRKKLQEINFSDIVDATVSEKEEKSNELNICVGSMITPKEGFTYYKTLLDYLGESVGMKVNFIETESYAEVNALLEVGKIDVAFVCGGPYIEGREKFGLELLVAPQVDGKTVYYSYIIARRDEPIYRLEDLKDKTFVFVDPLSNTGKIYPTYLLKQAGTTPEKFFKEYLYSYAHDTSIRAVSEGFADAGAVDSIIWNYLEKKGSPFIKNTRIIIVSPPFGIPPVVASPFLKRELKEEIKKVFLNMHNNMKGKEILERMSIDRFVIIKDFEYNSIRDIKKVLDRQ